MSGVRRLAVVSGMALAGLSPLEALARDIVSEGMVQAPVASGALRGIAAGLLLAGSVFSFWRTFRREAACGRGKPLPPTSEIDAAWLERHVFSVAPELVGAAYDRHIAGPEVAALLARMHGESKLASRVASGARGWNNLELWLLVEREELSGHERELVDLLFFEGRTTSSDRLQQHYGAAGFEPGELLQRHLNAASDALLGLRPRLRWPARAAVAVACLVLPLTLFTPASGIVPVILAVVLGGLGPLWGASVFAPRWSRDPERSASSAWPCLLSTAASLLAILLLILAWPSLPPLGALGVSAWGLAGAALVARALARRESPEGFGLRRNLLAARRFFAQELERPEPRLRDEWLPYLIALELNREVSHWYLAYGRLETSARLQRLAEKAGQQDAEANPAAWTGGAGALGGVGESGAWIAAASSLRVVASRERPELGGGWNKVLELRPV